LGKAWARGIDCIELYGLYGFAGLSSMTSLDTNDSLDFEKLQEIVMLKETPAN
jgi:hypothetical protein